MKRALLFFLLSVLSCAILAQVSGFYSEGFWHMTIDSPRMLIWGDYPPSAKRGWFTDTIANLQYKQINKNQILVNSVVTTEQIREACDIRQSQDSLLKDSVRFDFEFPPLLNSYDICLHLENKKGDDTIVQMVYKNKSKSIKIPQVWAYKCRDIDIRSVWSDRYCFNDDCIIPKHLFIELNTLINPACNVFSITNHRLTEYYFTQYQLHDVVMNVIGDSTIVFDGSMFRLTQAQQNFGTRDSALIDAISLSWESFYPCIKSNVFVVYDEERMPAWVSMCKSPNITFFDPQKNNVFRTRMFYNKYRMKDWKKVLYLQVIEEEASMKFCITQSYYVVSERRLHKMPARKVFFYRKELGRWVRGIERQI